MEKFGNEKMNQIRGVLQCSVVLFALGEVPHYLPMAVRRESGNTLFIHAQIGC